MKCKIETRTVVKTKPETKCERVPKQFCRKERCTSQVNKIPGDKDTKSGCYFREQTVSTLEFSKTYINDS